MSPLQRMCLYSWPASQAVACKAVPPPRCWAGGPWLLLRQRRSSCATNSDRCNIRHSCRSDLHHGDGGTPLTTYTGVPQFVSSLGSSMFVSSPEYCEFDLRGAAIASVAQARARTTLHAAALVPGREGKKEGKGENGRAREHWRRAVRAAGGQHLALWCCDVGFTSLRASVTLGHSHAVGPVPAQMWWNNPGAGRLCGRARPCSPAVASQCCHLTRELCFRMRRH